MTRFDKISISIIVALLLALYVQTGAKQIHTKRPPGQVVKNVRLGKVNSALAKAGKQPIAPGQYTDVELADKVRTVNQTSKAKKVKKAHK